MSSYQKQTHGLVACVVGVFVAFHLCGVPICLAEELTGTVLFEGVVSFADPNGIAGIGLDDLTVSVKPEIASEGGVKCEVGATTSDSPDADGTYPGVAGNVSAEITMSKGNGIPEDTVCVVTLRAVGTNGVDVSARGWTSVFVDPNQLAADATIAGADIVVQQSKPVAGLSTDCLKWMKKQNKKRAKCNFLILKKGGEIAADKCKDACRKDGPRPCEPEECDPGNYTEEILAFSHDGNDQQTDPASGLGVDYDKLDEQVKCQKHLGFAAANYVKKRNVLVQRNCIDDEDDSEDCRAQQSRDAKPRLLRIDNCADMPGQRVDVDSLLAVPDVKSPCTVCIAGDGKIDTKCMKSCFQSVLDEYSDLMLGDIPECGNGIIQPPETCDDGDTDSGDGCNEMCRIEPAP